MLGSGYRIIYQVNEAERVVRVAACCMRPGGPGGNSPSFSAKSR